MPGHCWANTTSIWEIAFFHAEYCKINCTRWEFMFDKKEICFGAFFSRYRSSGISDGMGGSEHGWKKVLPALNEMFTPAGEKKIY